MTKKVDKRGWREDMKEFWHEVMDLNYPPEKGIAEIMAKHNLDLEDIIRRYLDLNYGNYEKIDWKKKLKEMLSL